LVPEFQTIERMRHVILPGDLSALFGELIPFVPCTALILIARRLPVIQHRHYRLHLTGALVCAIALWVGPLAGTIGALLACWLEGRFFLHDRASRIAAMKSGAAHALASAAACVVLDASPPLSGSMVLTIRMCALAWEHAAPAVLTFVAVNGIAFLALNRSGRHRAVRQSQITMRLRAGVALAGFTPLILSAPLSAAFGGWALVPFIGMLAAVGYLVQRSSEITRLRRQLSVSQAMGLASLADTATAEPTALLYRFLHLANNLVHAERSLVWMVDETNGEIIPAVGLPNMGEFAGVRTRVGEGLIGSSAERSRPLVISDAARIWKRAENEPAADSWLLCPIISQQRVLGVAHWMRPAAVPFTTDDAAQLEGLVPQVGVAIESMRARNRMREMASSDGLTGLLNHRRITELLRDEMRRAERYNRPLSVLMVDLDSFKSINDDYGHPVGDQLLRSVAQLLRGAVRTVDSVGRYGGEEFIILMPETHKDDAYLLAERIRSIVEQKAFVVIDGQQVHRTISVGVASYPEDGLNPQEIVERADEALYRAKHAGKNCVIWA
jgi:diguanylate cyclase (GGDEF)-like protein